ELEARRRPRGGLVEEVHDRAAAKRRELLHLPLEAALEAPRRGEQPLDVVAREVADRDQVPPRRRAGREQILPHDAYLSHRTPLRSSRSAAPGRPRPPRGAAPGCAP